MVYALVVMAQESILTRNERPDLKLVLMSATVDPSAFQSYFEGIHTVSIPGKTNFPIQDL